MALNPRSAARPASGRRVDHTTHLAAVEPAQAALVTGDARPNAFRLTRESLVHQVGVGQRRPHHADHVSLSGSDDLIGATWLRFSESLDGGRTFFNRYLNGSALDPATSINEEFAADPVMMCWPGGCGTVMLASTRAEQGGTGGGSCGSARWPAPPAMSDGNDNIDFVVAVRMIDFGEADLSDGPRIGYDLDATCTCGGGGDN